MPAAAIDGSPIAPTPGGGSAGAARTVRSSATRAHPPSGDPTTATGTRSTMSTSMRPGKSTLTVADLTHGSSSSTCSAVDAARTAETKGMP